MKTVLIALALASGLAQADIEKELNDPAREPITVRHDAAQPGTPITTKRYWRIKKGSFPEFLAASRDGVWPFFEKIGARVLGMWLVVHPEGEAPAGYDEVYLMTQYASVAHWRATRDMSGLGGNGEDWTKAREALLVRRGLTIETSLEFLEGLTWHNPPQYLPSMKPTDE